MAGDRTLEENGPIAGNDGREEAVLASSSVQAAVEGEIWTGTSEVLLVTRRPERLPPAAGDSSRNHGLDR